MSSTAPESLNQFVRAGAGAGKTFSLTHQVLDVALDLQEKNGRLPRMIVTTFTRKATQELKERLLLLALEEEKYQGLVKFVNSPSLLHISTIHGVMDLFLKRYGLTIGLDPSYSLISESEAHRFAKKYIKLKFLSNETFQNLLEIYDFNTLVGNLRHYYRFSLEAEDSRFYQKSDYPALAGSMFLKLSQKLSDFLERLRPVMNDKWAGYVSQLEDIEGLLSQGPKLSENDIAELMERLTVLSGTKKPSISKKNDPPELLEASDYYQKQFKKELFKILDPEYSVELNNLADEVFSSFSKIASEFASGFLDEKLRKGLLEIQDLELVSYKVLKEYPVFGESFSQEWDYFLIDEYQDTSPFQVKLLSAIVGNQPVYTVGDPQQSIYLFRGARSQVFFEREKINEDLGGGYEFKRINRRSEPETLHYINSIFKNVGEQFEEMEAFFGEDQKVEFQCEKTVGSLSALRELTAEDCGGDKNLVKGRNQEQEVHHIIGQIQLLLKVQPDLALDRIAILTRKNDTLDRFARGLSQFNFPVHVHSSSGFFHRREVGDAICLLRFIVNSSDNKNLVSLLRSPWMRISDKEIIEVCGKKPKSLWTQLKQDLSELPQVKYLVNLEQLTRSKGAVFAFERAIVECGLLDSHRMLDPTGRREANIWKLISLLTQEERKPGFNLVDFCSNLVQEINLEDAGSEGDAVAVVEPNRINLMTVHSSKGLEFDHVFIPEAGTVPTPRNSRPFTLNEESGLLSFRIPFGDEQTSKATLSEKLWNEYLSGQEFLESQRVFYVACSRAVKTIHMSWVGSAKDGSWASYMSEFVDRAEDSIVQESDFRLKLYTSALKASNYVAKSIPHEENRYKPVEAMHSSSIDFSVSEMVDSSDFMNKLNIEGRLMLNKRATEGTQLHGYLEALKFNSDLELENTEFQSAIDWVERQSSPHLLEIIKSGRVEWGFVFNFLGRRIEGQVDLFGRDEKGQMWVIDYKSGSDRYREKALNQLRFYALALFLTKQANEDESIHIAAVYPFEESIYIDKALKIDELKSWYSALIN